MSYDYNMFMEEALRRDVTYNTVNYFPTGLISIAVYVFIALSLYTIACRREIKKPWLAWIPVVNVWILGSLSDQYRYVVKGEVKSKRKSLTVLSVVQEVIAVGFVVLVIVVVVNAFVGMVNNLNEHRLMEQIMGPGIAMVCMVLPLVGVGIAYSILYYMALYDVYASCDPKNKVIYLVLSIIPGVSTIAQPLFLFLCRDKDEGMPPRRQAEPVYTQEEPVFAPEEPPVWEVPQEEEPWQDTETE